ERDDETAGEERQRGERVDREHQRQVVRRVIQADAEADEPEQGDDRAAGVDHRFGGEERVGGPALEARAGYVGEHAAGTDAEQRNRDREEREVVIHDDRKDAGERELGHQERSGHERAAIAAIALAAAPLTRRPTYEGLAVVGHRLSGANANASRDTLIISALPTLLTLVYEWTTGHMPANGIRFAAGAPIGVAVAWLVI